jgi:regulatory protein
MAMDWLSRREYTQAEVRAKLASREIPDFEIEATVTDLVADGLVSDERFAECYVRSKVRRGKGPVRIRMELKDRGVSTELADQFLRDGDVDWVEQACEVRSKKFGDQAVAEFTERARQARFLQYRGFTSAQIQHALNTIAKNSTEEMD